MARSLALMTSLALLLGIACSAPREEADDAEAGEDVERCIPSRTMSEPCCPELDIDACGAGLVCAALDGRTVPTCYAESSRLDGSECSESSLCVSRRCNLELNRCQASPGAVCKPEIGCAPDPMGYERTCVTAPSGVSACEKDNLPLDSPCTFDRECQSNDCACGLGGCTCDTP